MSRNIALIKGTIGQAEIVNHSLYSNFSKLTPLNL